MSKSKFERYNNFRDEIEKQIKILHEVEKEEMESFLKESRLDVM